MKKIVRAIVVFLVSMLLLSGIVSGLALLPPVQSYLGRKVAAIVSENIPQDISIDSIRITPSGSVDLTGIKLEDHHRDTMIYIPRISARLSFWGLLSGQLRISRAEIKDPLVNIVKYSGEERDNLSLFISNFSRRRDDKAGKKELRLFALQTGLHGGKASYRDLNKPDSSLRYSLEHIKIKASRISVVKNDIHFDIDSLAMDSSLGTDIKNISGLFRFCPKGIIADRINITTGRSRLEFSAAAYFRDTTDSTLTLAEKLKASEMSLSVEPSLVNPEDAAFIYPKAAGLPPVNLSARMSAAEGTLDITGFKVRCEGVFSANAAGRISSPSSSKNLKDAQGKLILKNIRAVPEKLIRYAAHAGIKTNGNTIRRMEKAATVTGSGLVTLEKGNIFSIASLRSDDGQIFVNATADDIFSRREISYKAKISLVGVNLGLLTGSKDLGRVTLFSSISGDGLSPKTARAHLNTSAHLFEFKGYPYTDINITSALSGGKLESEISVSDPNLEAKINASLAHTDTKAYHATLDMYLDKSNLHALGLVRDSVVNLRGTIQADLTGTGINDAEGTLSFTEMSYNYYFINRILIESEKIDSTRRRLSIESDELFNGYIEGNYLLSEVPATILNGIMGGFKTYEKKKTTPGQQYVFELDLSAPDVRIINTPLVFYGIAHMDGRVDSSKEGMVFNLLAQRINYSNILVDTLTLRLDSYDRDMLSIKAEKFINPVYSIEKLDLSAGRTDDSLAIRSDFYKWNSADSIAFHINAYQKDTPDGNVTIGFLPSTINLENISWKLGGQSPDKNRILWDVDNGRLRIDSLSLTSGNASITAAGYYSSPEVMDMRLTAKSIDLSRSVLIRGKHPLQGILNGYFRLYKKAEDKTVVPGVTLTINGLAIDKDKIGDVIVAVNADLANRYVKTFASLKRNGRTSLFLSGGLNIVGRQLEPDMTLKLDSLDLSPVHYLLPSVFNISSGYASSDIHVGGLISKPDINGYIRLDDTHLGINFTNVEYEIPDSTIVPIRNSFFHFDKIRIKDVLYSTYGTLDGRIYHDNFKPWFLDLDVGTDNTLVLNTTADNNEKFYGRVFATGSLDLYGPTYSLKYDIKARTERNTLFAIDVGSTSDFKASDQIIFVPPKTSHTDSLLLNLKKTAAKKESTSEMDIAIEATPDAQLDIYLDKASGHMVQGRGSGKMLMHLTPRGTFTLDGSYELSSGNYMFVYRELIKRTFTLVPGGKITFDGDPANPMIDFSAVYKTTTKPSSYLSTVNENAREEVEMTITLTNNLSNPVYNFDITMPKAPENVREELAYRLSDQEQLNQQFISLMAFNAFTNTGGEGENQNAVATGVAGLTAGMLSSQFSNIIQRFVSGVDINVNLNTSTNKALGTTESTDLEVGISTKLFNDRVTVNGVVGVPTGTTQSNLVGDVEIEYSISRDGRFRGVFVNRRQEDYMNNQQGYIQSLGVSYRQEFNNFRELGRLIAQTFRRKTKENGKESGNPGKNKDKNKDKNTKNGSDAKNIPETKTVPPAQKDTVTRDSSRARITFK